MSEQTCIFIVGMHRSGTSALTGALQILGCGLGSNLIGPYKDNPKGFFEHEKIWRMNQEFLESRGSSWDDPFLHDPYAFAEGETDEFKQQITEFLRTEFKDEPLIAIKDPRICMLFPLWLDVCRSLNIKTLVVLPLRNPFEVAQSLEKRNDFPVERGLIMWMNHTLAAELVTRDLARVFVSYEALLREPVAVLKKIGNGLSLQFPRDWSEATAEVEQFMDRGLRHHTHAESASDNALVTIVLDYFKLLCDVAQGERQPETVIGEIDRFRRRYLDLFTTFMHRDMTGLFQDRYRLWHADHLLAQSGERVRQLEHESDELRRNISDLQSQKEQVEALVREMQGTKVWRLAEFLRKRLPRPADCRARSVQPSRSGEVEAREQADVEPLERDSAVSESTSSCPDGPVAGKNGQDSQWRESELAFLEQVRTEQPAAISVIPPNWRGVRSASQNLVSRCLLIGDDLDESEATRMARLIRESGCEKLFFGGFPHSYVHLINALQRDAPQVRIYVFWLSSFLQTNEDYAWHSFQLIDQLCREGKIRKWGFAKKGMAETVAARGVRAEFIMSYVRPVPDGPSRPEQGGPHLGLWALAPIWRKTPYAMLAAAAAVKDAEVSVVGHDERAREFAEYLGLNVRYHQKPLELSEMPAALARMHLNLYVTLSECSPMLPMESLAVGAPCLLGPTSHLFEDHQYLHSRLVVPYPDRSEVIAEYIQRALGERDEIIKAYLEYAPDYNRRAHKTLTDFLEVAEDSVL